MKLETPDLSFLNEDIAPIRFLHQLRDAGPEERQRLRATVLQARSALAHSGTTIVGFLYRHGIATAADRQTTHGWNKSFESVKIYPVGSHSVVGMAGMVACIQETYQVLCEQIQQFELWLKNDLFIAAHGRLLERILKSNFFGLGILGEILGYVAVPILGGVNPREQTARLYLYDSAGAIDDVTEKVCKYGAVGSGGVQARTVLDRKWAVDMSQEDAVRLAVEAIYAAGMRDIGSGPVQVAPPTVALATTSGVSFVPEEQTALCAYEIYTDDMKRRGVVVKKEEASS